MTNKNVALRKTKQWVKYMLKKPGKLSEILRLQAENKKKNEEAKANKTENMNKAEEGIPGSICIVKERLQAVFSECSDFVLREINSADNQVIILIAYIDGLIDMQLLNQYTIEPLTSITREEGKEGKEGNTSITETIKKQVITNSDIKEIKTFSKTISSILSGNALVFIEGESIALEVGIQSTKGRAVAEPDTEISIRGSREGFVENLRVNTTLLRRTIKNPNFKIESMTLGEQTQTDIALCYIKGLANDKIVQEARRRLAKIKIDAVLESGYIEHFIEDNVIRLFPVVGNSEKPDKVAAKLLEGRVAILCDGTPIVLTVPYLFVESIQSTEDYYGHPVYSSVMRILRLSSLLITMGLPALYVALVAFHQTVIPFKLLLTMAASREGIPFSPFVEALLMITTFELLREAGVRMPRPIGQAVSIVGAIVLGEAAVQAGIASAPMVIVTALTAICSFIVPPLLQISLILRYVLLIAANMFGLFGISIVFVIIFAYLCTKRSFGVPYLSPFAPMNAQDLKDTFIVVPIWAMITRPRTLTWDKESIKTRTVSKLSPNEEGLKSEKP